MERLRERASEMRTSERNTHESNLSIGEVGEDETGLMYSTRHDDVDVDDDYNDDDDHNNNDNDDDE